MIDEKKLIEKIEDVFCEDCTKCQGSCRFGEIVEIVLRQPKVCEWIQCSERLPNTYDNLLVCQSDGYVNVGYYSLNEFKDVNSYPYKDVIAWQPLPEPYKEAGD